MSARSRRAKQIEQTGAIEDTARQLEDYIGSVDERDETANFGKEFSFNEVAADIAKKATEHGVAIKKPSTMRRLMRLPQKAKMRS